MFQLMLLLACVAAGVPVNVNVSLDAEVKPDFEKLQIDEITQ
jgi:hypothetical protein